jgi:hypothetical protein
MYFGVVPDDYDVTYTINEDPVVLDMTMVSQEVYYGDYLCPNFYFNVFRANINNEIVTTTDIFNWDGSYFTVWSRDLN